MTVLVGEFVERGAGARVKVSLSWDWLRAQADQLGNTVARHLFADLLDMGRSGAGQRTLDPQAFSRLVGWLRVSAGAAP